MQVKHGVYSSAVLAAALGLLGLTGCASAPGRGSPVRLENARLTWQKDLPGLATDLALARGQGGALIATVPRPDPTSGPREPRLIFYSPTGEESFSLALEHRVRHASIADDASLLVVSNHEDEITGLDSRGTRLWQTESHCRPTVLSRARKIFCLHDDDAKPGLAFELLDWNGKRVYRYRIEGDVLAADLARDEHSGALGLTGGRVHRLNSDFRRAWQRKVPGEILDVAIATGDAAPLFALAIGKRKRSELTAFDSQGRELATLGIEDRAYHRIEASPDGRGVFALGNGTTGQVLTFFALSPAGSAGGRRLAAQWTREEPKAADFSPPLVLGESVALFGSERITPEGERATRITGYSFDKAEPLWMIPVVTEEGAYLFAERPLEGGKSSSVTIATDDGRLLAFETAPTQN